MCGASIDYDDGKHTHGCDLASHVHVQGSKYHLHHCPCGWTWIHSDCSQEWGQLV